MSRREMLAQNQAVIGAALAAAAETNMRLSELAVAMLRREQVQIRRIFLFRLETGVDFGFVPEEFGHIEPFASIVVPRS